MAKTVKKKKPVKRAPRIGNARSSTNRDDYSRASINVFETSGRHGEKRRSREPHAFVDPQRTFNVWVAAAARKNARGVATQPKRIFVRKREVHALKLAGHSYGEPLFRTRPVPKSMRDYLLGYGRSTPSIGVMTKIADLGPDFEVLTESHPALDLRKRVNAYWNGFDLDEYDALHLQLTGNAYEHVVVDESTGVPVELWPMPSHWSWVIPSRETWIAGYVYGRIASDQVSFLPDEVIHYRRPNPNDLFYGLGWVEEAWPSIVLHQAKREHDSALFDNNARPDYALIVKNATPDALDRFEQQIETRLRGPRKAGRMMSFKGDVDIKPLSWPPKDLGDQDNVVEEIAAVSGVPVTLLKANDPNLASAEVGWASWREDGVAPLARLLEDKWNESYLPLWGDDIAENAVLAFDNPVVENKQQETTRRIQLVNSGIMLINDAAAAEGLDPVDGGDIPRVNGVPLDTLGKPHAGLGGFPFPMPMPKAETPAMPSAADLAAEIARELRRGEKQAGSVQVKGVGAHKKASVQVQIDGEAAAKLLSLHALILDDVLTGDGREHEPHVTVLYGLISDDPKQCEVGLERAGAMKPLYGPNRMVFTTIRKFAADEHDVLYVGVHSDALKNLNRCLRETCEYENSHPDYTPHFTLAYVKPGSCDRLLDRKAEAPAIEFDKVTFAASDGVRYIIKIPHDRTDRHPDGHETGRKGHDGLSDGRCGCGSAHVPCPPGQVQDRAVKDVDRGVLHGEVSGGGSGELRDDAVSVAGCDAAAGADHHRVVSLASLYHKAYGTKAEKPQAGLPNDDMGGAIPGFTDSMRSIFGEQADEVAKEIASRFRGGKPTAAQVNEAIREVLSQAKWQEVIAGASRQFIEPAVQLGGVAGVGKIDSALLPEAFGFDVTNPKVQEFVNDYTVRLARSIQGTTEVALSNLIGDGMEKGESITELVGRIREYGGADVSGARAEMIARTESARAYVEGEDQAWQEVQRETGLKVKKSWLLAPDPCPICEAIAAKFAEGQQSVGAGEVFLPNGATVRGKDGSEMKLDYDPRGLNGPPAHPGCRCDVIATVEEG